MNLFRIAHPKYADPLSGHGAFLNGGRWNSKGTSVIYYGATQSLAILEKRVHLKSHMLNQVWTMIHIEIPDNLVAPVNPAALAQDWEAEPPVSTMAIGDAWVLARTSVGLQVPSKVSPMDTNVLLNPAHPDFRAVTVIEVKDFIFDARLGF